MNRPYLIELLGGLRIQFDGKTVAHFRTQKTAALLAYLASFPRRAHSREELIELFWPDTDIEAGRTSLRTALSALRKHLELTDNPEQNILLADRLQVQLDPAQIVTDVGQFEQALKAAERSEDVQQRVDLLAQAVELYRGPFLPGFYEDWTIRERERLEQALLGALSALSLALENKGDFDRAIQYAQRIVHLDPLQEEAHGNLMRLYAASGQPTALRKQYDHLKTILRREIGALPATETQALFEQLTQTPQPRHRRPEATPSPAAAPVAALAPPRLPLPDLRESTLPKTVRLPMKLTRFFGREEERTRLAELLLPDPDGLVPSRLTTLTGAGGAGKTRLALETARNLPPVYDTICFVGLAEITEPELVLEAILQALDVKKTSAPPLDLLAEALGQRPTLLILDNFEQIAETGAHIVWELLERLPALVCLVTSRQRLDLGGEQEFPLSPLPVPSLPGTPERLMEFPSIQLYVDRVRAVRHDFQLTPQNAATVAALCAKLEGIPLATELAAAWAATLTPAQTLQRLESRFDLLASRHRDLPTRHRTLRAAIEWSYRLLSPELQFFFARLSVFHSGWTLEAAQDVCEESDALEYLQQLRDRSLVLSEEVEEAMRYRMLESLREFAAEALPVQEGEETRQRHLEYYARFVEQVVDHQYGAGERQWLQRLDLEHDNIRAALDFALEAPVRAEWGLRLSSFLSLFWRVRGHVAEGRRRYAAALNRKGAEERTMDRAEALSGAATLALAQDDLEEAERLLSETASIRREHGDKKGMPGTLNNLGLLVMEKGDYAKAQPLFEESLALSRAMGNRYTEATTLQNLAIVATLLGDAQKERALFEECLALRRELKDLRGVTMALANLAQSLCTHKDLPAARLALLEGLELCREMGDVPYSIYLMEVSALLLFQKEMGERATRLLGAAHAARKAFGKPIPLIGNEYHASVLASLREQLGEAAFDKAWSDGQLLSQDQALTTASEELAQLS